MENIKIDLRLNQNKLSEDVLSAMRESTLIERSELNAKIAKLYGALYAEASFNSFEDAVNLLNKIIKKGNVLVPENNFEEAQILSKMNNITTYAISPSDGINYELLEKKVEEIKPSVIFAAQGVSQRPCDFRKIKIMANNINATLVAVLGHNAGLAAAGCVQNPVFWADYTVLSFDGSLRGPAGSAILTNNKDYLEKIESVLESAGENMGAKLVATEEAISPKFGIYARKCVTYAKNLSKILSKEGFKVNPRTVEANIVCIEFEKAKEALSKLEKNNILASLLSENTIAFETSLIATLRTPIQDVANIIIKTLK